ncbi:Mechanosensitive ion channel-domain-containing protein [Leptodontidium sp. 2 PMI_412]|nr:Mechanosensitive ion channel-domain-containing protein [Leptodontidium sp. MPI-SDFR-AT-0119]KAH9205621.1 Mechanosensitive ion channel-domain-containing protein [Leptodontidium sp. 2 PMI_412]
MVSDPAYFNGEAAAIKVDHPVETLEKRRWPPSEIQKLYRRILGFPYLTKILLYVLPVGALLAIPIICGATVAKTSSVGGVRILWLFIWIEVVWISLWVSHATVIILPFLFRGLLGMFKPGWRDYGLAVRALRTPLGLLGWTLCSLATFAPIMLRNPDSRENKATLVEWQRIVQKVLAAAVVSSLVYFAESALVVLLSISYHRKQFDARIQESKKSIHFLVLLYSASRVRHPEYIAPFAEEDCIIHNSPGAINAPRGNGQESDGHQTKHIIEDVWRTGNRVGDHISAAVGEIAREFANKRGAKPNPAYSLILQVLESRRRTKALAGRIWCSLTTGSDTLRPEDLAKALHSPEEVEQCMEILDRDKNGDVGLEEMILAVDDVRKTRRSIAMSLHDVDQAIAILDGLLQVVVFVGVVLIFVAFLNRSFVTTLATTGTALLSLSFVFATTAQEVLGSCIFLFAKHPFDVGDRVDINNDQLTVTHISLLFTTFKRVSNHRTVQIPNNILNSLWVENVSRSEQMREQVSIFVSFSTSFDDIQTLQGEMRDFVQENPREFSQGADIQLLSTAELNKLELRLEICHKRNWANESVRAAQRSKFMYALVTAMRKVPVNAPGGGDAALGDKANASYSVSISSTEALYHRQNYKSEQDSKRLHPLLTEIRTDSSQTSDGASHSGVQGISQRSGGGSTSKTSEARR